MTSTDAADEPAADVSTLSYEQARDQLVEVVQKLEAGSLALEDSLTLWERGEALAARCQQWLDGARERLDAAHEGGSAHPSTNAEDAAGEETEDTEENDA